MEFRPILNLIFKRVNLNCTRPSSKGKIVKSRIDKRSFFSKRVKNISIQYLSNTLMHQTPIIWVELTSSLLKKSFAKSHPKVEAKQSVLKNLPNACDKNYKKVWKCNNFYPISNVKYQHWISI